MTIRKTGQDERGSTTVEYVIFVAAAGIILVVGVSILFHALSDFFASWAGYFAAG